MFWTPDWIEETARKQLVIRALLSGPSPFNDGWDRGVKIGVMTLTDPDRGVLLLYENDWWHKRTEARPGSLTLTIATAGDDLKATLIEPFMKREWLGHPGLRKQRDVIVISTTAVTTEVAPSHPMILGEFARIMGRVEDRLGEEMALVKREALTTLLFRLDHFYNNAVRDIARPLGLMP